MIWAGLGDKENFILEVPEAESVHNVQYQSPMTQNQLGPVYHQFPDTQTPTERRTPPRSALGAFRSNANRRVQDGDAEDAAVRIGGRIEVRQVAAARHVEAGDRVPAQVPEELAQEIPPLVGGEDDDRLGGLGHHFAGQLQDPGVHGRRQARSRCGRARGGGT